MKNIRKKIFKGFLYLTALIIIFLGSIFLMLQYFFPSSFLISKIESYLKDNYNLGLKIERLDFSLFKGVTVEKFTFTDNDMPDSLFSMESFNLKYDLWPLLDKKLVVKTMVLEHPKITVVKDVNGRFNFDGIIEKFAGKKDEAKDEKKPVEEKPVSDSTAPQFIIDLRNFEVNDIDVSYEDRSSENPMSAKLPLYSLKISDVNFRDMDNLKADVMISTAEKNELSFRDKQNSVKFLQDLNITVKAKNENITIGFSHKMKDLKLFSPAVNLEGIGDIGVDLTAYYNLKSDSLEIRSFGFYLDDMLKTKLKGSVTGLTTQQVAVIEISEVSADVGKIVELVSSKGLADLQGVNIKNSFFDLKNVKIKHIVAENLTDVSGSMDFSVVDLSYMQKDISAAIKYLMVNSVFALVIKDNKLLSSSVDLEMELESINANVSGKKYSTGRQSLTANPILKSDFMPESVNLDYEISDIAEGNIGITVDAAFDVSDLSVSALIKNTKADITFKAERLHPHILESTAPENLFVTIDEKLNYAGGIVENTVNISTEFKCDTASVYSAADGREISAHLKADISGHPKERYKLIELTAKINDMLSADLKDISADLKTMAVSVGKFEAFADLDQLLEVGKATGIPQIQNTKLYNGYVNISADGSGNVTKQESTSELRLSLNIDSLYHDDIAIKKGVKVNQTVNLLTKDVSLIGDIAVNSADYAGMLKDMGIEGNIRAENNIRYAESGEIRILKLSMAVPSLETEFNVKGTADIKDSVDMFDLELSHKIGLKENYSFVKGIGNIKGVISGVTKLKGNPKTASVEHTESLKDIGLLLELDSLGNKVKIINLNAEIPFNAKLDIEAMKLLGIKKFDISDDFNFLEYSTKRDYYKLNGVPVSNFRIDTIAVAHKMFNNNIKNIDLDIYFDDNKFCLNRFYYELFDGNAAGYLRLDVKQGGMDGIVNRADLDMGITMTGLNTYYLNRAKTKRSPSTEMNVIMKLKSKGLDIINEPDLNGEINVSKISGDDAQYLLEFLNKNSGDQTAGMVKNMLNAFPGIKVDLFSFTIKNNFLYTLIKLKKPWYLVYFPLSEQISLSKQSLKFYLDKYVKDDL
ncbi:MAG: AsmA family protein [Candidatus Delongbacteria bacterium]|nr:AsmA family protein [Candidatus Delongbacteria bacterium]